MKMPTWKKRVASVQFSEDAGQAPHIDGGAIPQPQHDFWAAVEPALDIAVHLFPFKAAAAKVYHLHSMPSMAACSACKLMSGTLCVSQRALGFCKLMHIPVGYCTSLEAVGWLHHLVGCLLMLGSKHNMHKVPCRCIHMCAFTFAGVDSMCDVMQKRKGVRSAAEPYADH